MFNGRTVWPWPKFIAQRARDSIKMNTEALVIEICIDLLEILLLEESHTLIQIFYIALLTRSIRDSETSTDFVQGPPGSRRERVKSTPEEGGVIIMQDPSSSCREIKATVYYKGTDVIVNTVSCHLSNELRPRSHSSSMKCLLTRVIKVQKLVQKFQVVLNFWKWLHNTSCILHP